jgi:hypothetical protein
MFKGKQFEKHLAKIEALLDKNESVIFAGFAAIVTEGDLGTDSGAIVVTNFRVLFSGNATLLGTSSEAQVSFHEINGVSSGRRTIKGGLIQPYLEINAGGSVYLFNMKQGEESQVQEAISQARSNNSNLATNLTPENNSLDALEKLSNLLEKGLLTREEFETEKRKLLDP